MDNKCGSENSSKFKSSGNMLRIAGVVKESIVDGPGIRYVVFTQGCPHHCPGCHNPGTHDFNAGKLVDIKDIEEDIKKNPLIRGVTISGGEPFAQAKTVSKLIDDLRNNSDKPYDFMVYTGYKFENLVGNANETNGYMNLLNNTDVLMDGRFVEALKNENTIFRGSTNQRAIDIKESLESGEVKLHEF